MQPWQAAAWAECIDKVLNNKKLSNASCIARFFAVKFEFIEHILVADATNTS